MYTVHVIYSVSTCTCMCAHCALADIHVHVSVDVSVTCTNCLSFCIVELFSTDSTDGAGHGYSRRAEQTSS